MTNVAKEVQDSVQMARNDGLILSESTPMLTRPRIEAPFRTESASEESDEVNPKEDANAEEVDIKVRQLVNTASAEGIHTREPDDGDKVS